MKTKKLPLTGIAPVSLPTEGFKNNVLLLNYSGIL